MSKEIYFSRMGPKEVCKENHIYIVAGENFGPHVHLTYSNGDYELWHARAHKAYTPEGTTHKKDLYLLVKVLRYVENSGAAMIIKAVHPGLRWKAVPRELIKEIDRYVRQ